jgi:hypothetical protein
MTHYLVSASELEIHQIDLYLKGRGKKREMEKIE